MLLMFAAGALFMVLYCFWPKPVTLVAQGAWVLWLAATVLCSVLGVGPIGPVGFQIGGPGPHSLGGLFTYLFGGWSQVGAVVLGMLFGSLVGFALRIEMGRPTKPESRFNQRS